jgi:hypothetical protein
MACQRLEEAAMKVPSPSFLIALWKSFPLIRSALAGACAGSLFEARLAREKLKRVVHTYSPVFRDEGCQQILRELEAW